MTGPRRRGQIASEIICEICHSTPTKWKRPWCDECEKEVMDLKHKFIMNAERVAVQLIRERKGVPEHPFFVGLA